MKKSELINIIREELSKLNERPKTEFIAVSVTPETERDWINYPKVRRWVKSNMKKYQVDEIDDELYGRKAIKITKIPAEDLEKTKLAIEKIYKKYGFKDYILNY